MQKGDPICRVESIQTCLIMRPDLPIVLAPKLFPEIGDIAQ